MIGSFPLDWLLLSISLFNTIALLWLGLTVLLNAERRTPGIWLAGGGLLLGGLFFISHTAILGHGVLVTPGMDFWWHLGWIPVAALPYAWYVVILWYTGYWESGSLPGDKAGIGQRHRPWLLLSSLLAGVILGLLIFGNPLPSFFQIAVYDLTTVLAVGGIPLIILVYPPYILLCLVFALDALRRPGPTNRLMGDAARSRARPWLVAASLLLLLVCLLVGAFIFWAVWTTRARPGLDQVILLVGWADLLIAGLIGVVTILLGQAIVAYEVFTGKSLPRRGLRRTWHNAIYLAAGISLLAGWSLAVQLRPVYALLLAILLLTVFYALLCWRSFGERENFIGSLRPFLASQQLYDQLLAAAPSEVDITAPFRILCVQVLAARQAALLAMGPLAPLSGKPVTHPEELALPSRLPTIFAPQPAASPLDPAEYNGMIWAVPLWSERGLIGVLLLGEKQDGGLYTQEEIEIARAAGERLIDTQASSEMARRLMALQRQRLSESQVVDRRARRALHDDVLPRLHTVLLSLSDNPGCEEAVSQLAEVHRQISDLLRDLPASPANELASYGLVAALQRLLADEFSGAFDSIAWEIDAVADQAVKALPPISAEVLFYAGREAFRNAARHARAESRPLYLRVGLSIGDKLQLVVEDDGVGIPAGRALPGSGHGLALHSTLMAVLGGTLSIESIPGSFTRITLSLPDHRIY